MVIDGWQPPWATSSTSWRAVHAPFTPALLGTGGAVLELRRQPADIFFGVANLDVTLQ